MKLDQTRKSKSLPKPLYDKIQQYITKSFVLDFNMLLKDNKFFKHLKPDLRYRLISEIFGDIYSQLDSENVKIWRNSFINYFRYLFLDNEKDFRASKELICEFVSHLYCRIFIPNQIIINKGETFSEMYLIYKEKVYVSLRKKG